MHRAVGGRDEYEHVASVAPRGSGEHEYVDRSALAGERYRYRLEVQRGASSSWEGPVDAVLPTGISALAFERVGPNPFERETRMVLALPRRDVMDVRVYDVQGARGASALHGGGARRAARAGLGRPRRRGA